MLRLLYKIGTTLATPIVATALLRRRHRPLLQRFRPDIPGGLRSPIWVQACSVGEVNLALPLIDDLKARHPEQDIILTVSTRTGHDLAVKKAKAPVSWFPFDQCTVLNRFFRALSPKALLLIDTELWPNLLHEARAGGVPVILVNGRISDRHFPRYQRVRKFLRPALQCITMAGVQEERYRERLIELGMNADRVEVTGSMKFDCMPPELDAREAAQLRDQTGLPPDAPVLVFGCTRPGDEILAKTCLEQLMPTFPELRLVIAPRHLERMDEITALFRGGIVRRSEHAPLSGDNRVLVVDTWGELSAFYHLATVAVIGGSFSEEVNGHNPIESVAQGIPTVFGPHMRNFADIARGLLEADAALQVETQQELPSILAELLGNETTRKRMAAAGRKVVRDNRGATARNVDLIERVLSEEGLAIR